MAFLSSKHEMRSRSSRTAVKVRRAIRHPRHAPAAEVQPRLVPVRLTDAQRARHAGGPQDRALYACGCGCAFNADVTSSVACPHCGGEQSW